MAANLPLIHPGEVLFEEFLKPLEISKRPLARRLEREVTPHS